MKFYDPRSSLSVRLSLLVITGSCLISLATALYHMNHAYGTHEQTLGEELAILSRNYNAQLVQALYSDDKTALQSALVDMSYTPDVVSVSVVRAGKALATVDNRVATEEPHERLQTYQMTLTAGSQVLGELMLTGSLDRLDRLIRTEVLQLVLTQLISFSLFALFTIWVFDRQAGRHLRHITRQLRTLGDRSVPAPISIDRPAQAEQRDELARLVFSINRLFAQLGSVESDRNKATMRLGQQEEMFQSLIDSFPIVYFRLNMTGSLLRLNKAGERLTNLNRKQLLGETVEQFFANPIQFGLIGDEVRAAAGRPVTRDLQIVNARGENLWTSFTARVLFDEQDEPECIEVFLRDITDEWDERQRLEDAVALLSEVANALPVQLVLLDAERNVRFVNRLSEEWEGKSLHEFVGRKVDEFIPAMKLPRLQALFSKALEGEPQQYEVEREYPDGKVRSLLVSLTPLRENVIFEGCLMTMADLTERNLLQAELSQSQKMEAIGQLTGGVAHDFNNLLAIILGNAEYILQESPTEDLSHLASGIISAAENGARLTGQLLSFSRKQSLRAEPLNICQSLRGTVEILERTLPANISIRWGEMEESATCLLDRGQLENAVINLALNARDAMPAGGVITISCQLLQLDADRILADDTMTAGTWVSISVADNGAGMSDDIQSRVFEPFFTTKQSNTGTGLGLSMVYGFVKQSGGHVVIDSDAGKGTLMTLWFPALMVEETLTDQAGRRPREGAGELILIVEDEADVRQLMVRMLKHLGYETWQAENSVEAIALLREKAHEIDLLLTDVMLPGGQLGPDVAAEARHLNPHMAIVYMTGYADVGAASALGNVDGRLLRKPFTRAKLAEELSAALAMKGRPV